MVILENIYIDIDKVILQNIDIDKILNRCKFGISNRAILTPPIVIIFIVLVSIICVKQSIPSSPFTRLVVAAPHLSRVVEDLSAALTLGLFYRIPFAFSATVNALVSTSPCTLVFTSVPGKCVVEVEEEEQNN